MAKRVIFAPRYLNPRRSRWTTSTIQAFHRSRAGTLAYRQYDARRVPELHRAFPEAVVLFAR